MAALSPGERIGAQSAAHGARTARAAGVACGLLKKSVRKSRTAVALRQGFRVLYVIEIIRVRAAEKIGARKSAQHDTTWDVDSNRYALSPTAEPVEPHCLILQAWRLFRFQRRRMSGLDQRLGADGRASDRG
jgi:hypothetical protein